MFTIFHRTAPTMYIQYRLYDSVLYRDTPTKTAITVVDAEFSSQLEMHSGDNVRLWC